MTASKPDIAYVDTIDACHLKCPSCLKGVRAIPNSSKKMPLDMFEQIVTKLNTAGYRKISLYNWTEPFLNRSLDDYIASVKKFGLFCELSTTLSLRHIDNLEAALVAGVDRVVVSMSGFSQTVYQINHVGGDVEYVLDNLRRIRSLLDQHALSPQIVVKMIRFDYNAEEQPKLRELADELRFDFEVIEGMSHPTSQLRAQRVGNEYYENIIAKSGPSDTPEASGQVCPLLFDQITIDVVGDVHLCCAFPTFAPLRIGSYLEMSDDEILLRRYAHPLCRVCHMPRRSSSPGDGERIALAIHKRFMYEPEDARLRRELEATTAALQQELNQQRAEHAEAEKRLEQAHASASWTLLTGPLRSVARLIKSA